MRLAIDERVDLSSALEDSVIQLRKEVPQELVVSMFQKLVRSSFSSSLFRPFVLIQTRICVKSCSHMLAS